MVTLWTDSTYKSMSESEMRLVSQQAGVPMIAPKVVCGGGLTKKGQENELPAVPWTVAQTVLVEMGYNDPEDMTLEQALAGMRRQSWYSTLSSMRDHVGRVVFIRQEGYHQMAGARAGSRATTTRALQPGQWVHGSRWTDAVARAVGDELRITTLVAIIGGDWSFRGFIRDVNGELWQDPACCRQTAADPSRVWWMDAYHPTHEGAREHLMLLLNCLHQAMGPRWWL